MHSGELDEKLAQCARAFSESTGLGCSLSTGEGEGAWEFGYSCQRCDLCRVAGVEKQRCVEAHIYSMNAAERFGGRYIYFCPLGLTCFVSPLVGEEGVRGKLTAGPFTMVDKEEFLQYELGEKAGLSPQALEQARGVLEQVPMVEPARVEQLSLLLFFAVGFFNDFSAESRMLDRDRSAELQGEITSYILELKREEGPKPYPFQTERALLESAARQDGPEVRRLLGQLLGAILYASGRDLEESKSRIGEVLALLSRAAVEGGAPGERALSLSHQYRRELDALPTVEALCAWAADALGRYAQSLFPFAGARHAQVIRQCTAYIHDHYSQKITLEDMARRVYLSPSYLSRIFKRETGVNFNEYLNQVRIKKAQELLRIREIRMTDISLLVGFEDQSYFTRVFRRVTGALPRDYRERVTGRKGRPHKEETT